jgi:hypothetical protein
MNRILKAAFLSAYSVLLWRLIAGGLLFYASFDKIDRPRSFSVAIEAYKLAPAWALDPLAWLIPRVELLAGCFLALGILTRAAALISGGLYAVFTVGIAQALLRGLDITDCGCGITGAEPISWALVVRDIVLLAMCALAFFAPSNRLALDRVIFPKPQDQSPDP